MTLAKTTAGADALTANAASQVLETIPLIMHFISGRMKERPNSQTSVSQIRVLSLIAEHPGCSLTPLSEYLGITSASASTMVDRLVKSGLVDRLTDPLKRRNVVLHLTPLGQNELEGALKLSLKALSDQMSGLNGTQLKNVAESMTALKAIFNTVYGDFDALSEHADTTGETSKQWKRGSA